MLRMTPATLQDGQHPVREEQEVHCTAYEDTAGFLWQLVHHIRDKTDGRWPLPVVIHLPGVAVPTSNRTFTLHGIPCDIRPLYFSHAALNPLA